MITTRRITTHISTPATTTRQQLLLLLCSKRNAYRLQDRIDHAPQLQTIVHRLILLF